MPEMRFTVARNMSEMVLEAANGPEEVYNFSPFLLHVYYMFNPFIEEL